MRIRRFLPLLVAALFFTASTATTHAAYGFTSITNNNGIFSVERYTAASSVIGTYSMTGAAYTAAYGGSPADAAAVAMCETAASASGLSSAATYYCVSKIRYTYTVNISFCPPLEAYCGGSPGVPLTTGGGGSTTIVDANVKVFATKPTITYMANDGLTGGVNDCYPVMFGLPVVNCRLLQSTPQLPELSAGAITPIVATVGVPVTFSSTVRNTGPVGTILGFTNWFQSADDANGTNLTLHGSPSMAAIPSGSSRVATTPVTFTTAGTKYVRACADLPPLWVGVINESNEGNNCGSGAITTNGWTAVTVAPAALQCADGIDNDSEGGIDMADPGCSSSTDNNESDNPQCSDHSNNDGSEDSNVDYPADLGCTSAADNSESPNPVTGPTGTPSANIQASPTRVNAGVSSASTISWSAQNVSSCTISGGSLGSIPATVDASFQVATATASATGITTQTTFTISCTPTATDSVVVNVNPRLDEF